MHRDLGRRKKAHKEEEYLTEVAALGKSLLDGTSESCRRFRSVKGKEGVCNEWDNYKKHKYSLIIIPLT